VAGVGACASLSVPAVATAQNPDMSATAEQLFEEGRSLMARERFAEACPKLAESHRLDPGVGTLLNLGECYERQGRTASAWATYIEAETLANRQGQAPRAAFASKRAAELAPSLPKLSITVAETQRDGREVAVTVKRDGELLARPAWATYAPVDPGEHRIEASAPGFERFSQAVTVRAGQRVQLKVPPLAPSASPPAPPSAPSTQRIAGIFVGGAGVVVTGVGLAFGAVAKSKNDEARADFCTAVACKQRGVDLLAQADSAAVASTVLVSIGAAALVGGAFLFFTGREDKARRAAAFPFGGAF
jgi:serine/threonine-protein kinase